MKPKVSQELSNLILKIVNAIALTQVPEEELGFLIDVIEGYWKITKIFGSGWGMVNIYLENGKCVKVTMTESRVKKDLDTNKVK